MTLSVFSQIDNRQWDHDKLAIMTEAIRLAPETEQESFYGALRSMQESVFGTLYWAVIRGAALHRENPHCRYCKQTSDLEVYPIGPITGSEYTTVRDLLIECRPCHQKNRSELAPFMKRVPA